VTADKEVHESIEDYRRLVKEKEEIDLALEKAKRRIIELAAIKGQKSLSTTSGNHKIVATVSSRTTTKFNEEGLKKAIGAVSYKRLCKLVVDRRKVEEAIKEERVDPVVVAQFTAVTPSATYIRLSEKAIDDE